MADGGFELFDFVRRGHQLIELGKLDMAEWHRVIKIIFRQMAQSVDYIHSKQIAHFDVSLENFLINDIGIDCNQKNGKIKFVLNREDKQNDIRYVCTIYTFESYFYPQGAEAYLIPFKPDYAILA